MVQWHIDLYGNADDADAADDAIKAVVDAAKEHGLSSGYVSSPNTKRDVGADGAVGVDAAGRPLPSTDKGDLIDNAPKDAVAGDAEAEARRSAEREVDAKAAAKDTKTRDAAVEDAMDKDATSAVPRKSSDAPPTGTPRNPTKR